MQLVSQIYSMSWSFGRICNLLTIFFFLALPCVQLVLDVLEDGEEELFVLMNHWLKVEESITPPVLKLGKKSHFSAKTCGIY